MENKTYSLSELAREFKSSEDLINVHIKSLPAQEFSKDEQGRIVISEVGKNIIKDKLIKSDDTSAFQKQVLQKLTRIQEQLEQLTSSNKQNKPVSFGDDLSGLSEAIGDIPEALRWKTAYEDLERLTRATEANYDVLNNKLMALAQTVTPLPNGHIKLDLFLLESLLSEVKHNHTSENESDNPLL
ncbi:MULTISPECIES: hypothetical protein [unclassified Lactococcus]|uniref:hypothetical protein n=1 Tax=unclassified Lactococcus TaxID=2643510 RepID=UPI0011C83ABB|nr:MULTISPECIES: hypothetical protein [unclassified Lactococcus]MQW23401.1 hypothetical protein [Lactococcus sp. dk101]TXK36439.1 hypothetical protein FVP42_11360 [Lactococcus sp. dk310]TXK45823.1 hypothetical protein FVP43_11345 [Lactococcus sp. dk322]